jgi:hypothetical protein
MRPNAIRHKRLQTGASSKLSAPKNCPASLQLLQIQARLPANFNTTAPPRRYFFAGSFGTAGAGLANFDASTAALA